MIYVKIMTNKMIKTALTYKHKYGFSVIPTEGKVSRVKWTTYQDEIPTDEIITDWFTRWPNSNMAVITGKVSGYICVVDVDAYKDDSVMDSIKALIPDGLSFPISTTPRGGQHWWFRSTEQLGDRIGFLKGVDFRSMGIIIIPPSKSYKWLVTPKSTEIPLLPESILEALVDTSFDFGKSSQNVSSNGEYFSDGTRDVEMFSIANSLIKTGLPPGFAEDVLNRVMLSWGEENAEWSKAKVESAMKRHVSENLAENVKNWVIDTSGHFFGHDIDKDLNLSTTIDKGNRSKILSRLIKDGIIQRVGNKNGCFRRVEAELDEMDWRNAKTGDYYDLKMPLGLHDLWHVFPGNVIVIAGSPNAGKSAFVMNIVKMNNDKDIRYFNSEMGPEELKTRMMLFDDMNIEEWNAKFYNRNSSFSDVIEPDALNIIDFLEITDNFFMIADEIRKIHDKLGKGVAVICLQKKKDVELGRGAEFSLEKPRLYISLDFQKLKIIKCKNPKHGLNVNGKEIGFRLLHGTTFIEDEASYPFA